MFENEFDPTHWEKIGWQNYQRFKQVRNLRMTLTEFNAPPDKLDFEEKSLGFLLSTPQITLQEYFRSHPWESEALYERSSKLLEEYICTNHLTGVMSRFEQAVYKGGCASDISLSEDFLLRIGLQSPDGSVVVQNISPALTLAFGNHQDLLKMALDQGKLSANMKILEAIQEEGLPLIFWQSSVLQRKQLFLEL